MPDRAGTTGCGARGPTPPFAAKGPGVVPGPFCCACPEGLEQQTAPEAVAGEPQCLQQQDGEVGCDQPVVQVPAHSQPPGAAEGASGRSGTIAPRGLYKPRLRTDTVG